MTLPKKGSRVLEVEGVMYRWLVSSSDRGVCLTIEHHSGTGQVLQAFFDPHNLYRRDGAKWTRVRQRRTLGPGVTLRTIRHGLANGWSPTTRGLPAFRIFSWDTESLAGRLSTPEPGAGELELEAKVSEHLEELRFELSTSPKWRGRIIRAQVGERLPVPPTCGLKSIPDLGLDFVVFNDGWTSDGFVVFGFACDQIPGLEYYSTNNPEVWVE